jgi:hypothetical protein
MGLGSRLRRALGHSRLVSSRGSAVESERGRVEASIRVSKTLLVHRSCSRLDRHRHRFGYDHPRRDGLDYVLAPRRRHHVGRRTDRRPLRWLDDQDVAAGACILPAVRDLPSEGTRQVPSLWAGHITADGCRARTVRSSRTESRSGAQQECLLARPVWGLYMNVPRHCLLRRQV